MGFSKPGGDGLRLHGAAKKRVKTGPRSYNSYYEGYTEFYETDSRGKRKKRYVYTDPYYRQDLTKSSGWASSSPIPLPFCWRPRCLSTRPCSPMSP